MGGVLPFFVLAFGITWLLQLPAVFASYSLIVGPPSKFMPFVGLGAFGPMLAAILVCRAEDGRGAAGALFRQLSTPRVGASWYLVALAHPGTIFVAGMAVFAVAGGQGGGPWFYPPSTGARILAMFFFAFGEELGWRGFALPRLQRRYGPLAASLIIGVAWALWHIPMFTLAGISMNLLPLLTLHIVSGSVVLTWLYNRTGGSLLIAVLGHMGSHLNNSHQALPGNVTPVAVHAVAYAVVAMALIVVDKKAWRLPTPAVGRHQPDLG
jgi:uncharacterized protein